MRLGLYLRTSRGAAVLGAAIDSFVDIAFVVTATDHGMPDDGTERIRDLCAQGDIACYENRIPEGMYDDATHRIAAGWRSLLDPTNLIVLHDSLLPRYRGWSPLIAALIEGEGFVGVTAILAERDGFDTGPVARQRSAEVVYPQTIAQTIKSVEPLYYELTRSILWDWPTEGQPQDERDATYSIWRDDADYRIDWTRDAARIRRHVDACGHPHPGAWTTIRNGQMFVDGSRVIVAAAQEQEDVTFVERHPGKVLRLDRGRPIVVCGTGLLRLDVLAWPPGSALTALGDLPPLPLTSVRTRFA